MLVFGIAVDIRPGVNGIGEANHILHCKGRDNRFIELKEIRRATANWVNCFMRRFRRVRGATLRRPTGG